MEDEEKPEITEVDHIDNAVLVTFKDEGTTIYPADLLYAAKDLADIMWDEEQKKQTPTDRDEK